MVTFQFKEIALVFSENKEESKNITYCRMRNYTLWCVKLKKKKIIILEDTFKYVMEIQHSKEIRVEQQSVKIKKNERI